MSSDRSRCARCDREVEAEYRYPRMRHVAKVYMTFPLFMLPAFPFLAGDYVVSLPTMMVWALGTGPVLAIIKDPPTCRECGAFVPRPGASEPTS